MAPRAQRVKKPNPKIKTELITEFELTTETLLKSQLLKNARNVNGEDNLVFLQLISELYTEVGKLADIVSTNRITSIDLKQVLHKCLSILPKPGNVIHKKEIKTEIIMEEDDVHEDINRTQTVSDRSSSHPIQVGKASLNVVLGSVKTTGTGSIFDTKSFTLTSSDDDSADEVQEAVEDNIRSKKNYIAKSGSILENKSFTLTSSDDSSDDGIAKEVPMEIDSVSSGKTEGTASIFETKSFTLTSSEDDTDRTAISDATSRLEEMSMLEELDFKNPLCSSTPLKREVFEANSRNTKKNLVSESVTPKLEHVQTVSTKKTARDTEMKHHVESKSGFQPKDDFQMKRTLTIENESKSLKNFVNSRTTPSSYAHHHNLQTPKAECKPSIKTKSKRNIPTPEKEHNVLVEVPTNKLKHATDLRQKFLIQKTEKARMENDRRAAVLERKRAQEMIKQESYKSPSRSRTPSRHIEKHTPTQVVPSKKSRIHVSVKKEDKSKTLPKPVFPFTPPRNFPQSSCSQDMIIKSHRTAPDRAYKMSSINDYGLDDLKSDGDTDDEDRPRKAIPEWANFSIVRKKVQEHIRNPPFVTEKYFGPIEKPDLVEIFGKVSNLKKRGSSAKWN